MNPKPTPKPLDLTEIDRMETRASKPNYGARYWSDEDVLRLIATIRQFRPPQTITVYCADWRLTVPFSVAQRLKLSDEQRITPELAATITTGQTAASSEMTMGASIAGNGDACR